MIGNLNSYIYFIIYYYDENKCLKEQWSSFRKSTRYDHLNAVKYIDGSNKKKYWILL